MTYFEFDRKTCPPVFLRAFPGYKGRTIRARPGAKTVTLTGLYWSEGSRSSYALVNLTTGEVRPFGQDAPPEYGGARHAPRVELTPETAIVEHSIFCGKDAGLIIHIGFEAFEGMMPKAETLSNPERVVLEITGRYKSFAREDERIRRGMPKGLYVATKDTLIQRGLLRKNGSITPAGRNALAGLVFAA